MGLKGSYVDLRVTHQIYGGKAAGMHRNKPVITNHGITGQLIRVQIKRIKASHLEGMTTEVLEKSLLETKPACPHFALCGGCSMQGVPYGIQVSLKANQVKQLFQDHDIRPDEWFQTIESPRIYGYRNKMEYTFGNMTPGGLLTLGMHQRGRRYNVVDTPECNLIDEDFRQIRTATVRFFREAGETPFHKINHEGTLRHLVVRKAAFTGEILVNLVTAKSAELPVHDWKTLLLSLPLEGTIQGILWTHNNQVSDTVQCDAMEVLHGKKSIREKLLGLTYTITPFSFFQTNSVAAERLYETVLGWVDPSDQKVYDLYSGLGTITQLLAQKAKEVTGIELLEEAVLQAEEDARMNGIDNCSFMAGDVKEILYRLADRPDLLVVDPPRPGVVPRAMEELLALNPKRFIYISCNPKTLVENLKQAIACGWRINKARCVDLFPHTPHVECMVLLKKG